MEPSTMIAASSLVITLLLAVKVISLQRQLHTVQKQLRGDQASHTLGNGPLIVNAHLQAELRSLVENGQSIRAIKKLREATNLPLIEAKRMIDQLEGQIK